MLKSRHSISDTVFHVVANEMAKWVFSKKRLQALLFLLGSLVIVSFAKAADLETIETPRSGLEFQVGHNFQLESFSGSMISWKRLSSEHRGWRVGLSPHLNTSSISEDGLDGGGVESESDRYSIGVEIQKLFLGSLNNRTRSYWGIGPLIGFSYEDRKDSRYDQEGEVLDEYSFLIRQWNFGALALVGVEYFFLPNISLHGEYGFDLKYSVSESTRSDSKAKNLRLNSRSVRLGLCVLY